MSSLNLKYMLTNSSIATIYVDICILLFMLTLKARQQLTHEIIFMHVSVRNNAEACVLCIMCETWQVCDVYLYAKKASFLTSFLRYCKDITSCYFEYFEND